MNGRIVEFVIEDCTTPILNSIFDCSDDDNDNQRNSRQTRVFRAEDWEDL